MSSNSDSGGNHRSIVAKIDCINVTALFAANDRLSADGADAVIQGAAFGFVYVHPFQDEGTLSKRRRTGEFKKLTDAEVTSLEAIVNEAFEGFNALGTSPSEIHAGDEPEAVRELTFPDPQEAYVFDRGVVTFWGQDGERRVQCAVSREALDDHFKGDKKDKLEVFRANRRAIEEGARKKYLAGAIEPDGSVLIRTLDLAR